jgi:hypothetical protein
VHYQVVELDAAPARAAGELAIQYPLRACEAVKVASVLRVKSFLGRTEVTSSIPLIADNLLIAIIEAKGLLTDNPTITPDPASVSPPL